VRGVCSYLRFNLRAWNCLLDPRTHAPATNTAASAVAPSRASGPFDMCHPLLHRRPFWMNVVVLLIFTSFHGRLGTDGVEFLRI
jgi:hypothetical protein